MDGKKLSMNRFRLRIPGSKSYTNRSLIMAALTKGSVRLDGPLYSDDTKAMLECLRELGIEVETERDHLIVHGDIEQVEDKQYNLFARDSGTTVRFMLALLSIVPGEKIIQGSQRLNERPISDLVDALCQLGAKIEYCGKEGMLPVKITSSSLPGSNVRLSGAMSSQFCSALLLISPYLPNGLSIEMTSPLISKPYVEMTIGCMREWGIHVQCRENGDYEVPGNRKYLKRQYAIEGDFSSAGYFFAIAALTGATISVENLNPRSLQADRKFLDLLAKMGNAVHAAEDAITVQGGWLKPIKVNMEECPDQVMTMAVLAAFADGVTTISGVRSLRYKETERVHALKTELGKMGIKTEDTHDTLTIFGGSPIAAEIDTYNDHRMAMAFAVARTRLKEMTIRNRQVVNKTFPDFWEALEGMTCISC